MKKMISLALVMACLFGALGACSENAPNLVEVYEELFEEQVAWEEIKGYHLFDYTGTLMGIPCMKMESDDGIIYCFNTVYAAEGNTVYSRTNLWQEISAVLTNTLGTPSRDDSFMHYRDKNLSNYLFLLTLVTIIKESDDGAQIDFEMIGEMDDQGQQCIFWEIPREEGTQLVTLRNLQVIQNGETCYLTLLGSCVYTDADVQEQFEMLKDI